MGHDPDINALKPRVLKRNIMVNGVTLIKKPQKKLVGFSTFASPPRLSRSTPTWPS